MLYPLLLVIISFYLLYRGAIYLVEHSSQLAKNFGVTPIMVAVTIVAFGTSMPELLTSIFAGYNHQHDFVMGNIVGSNIANLALITGVAALIRRLSIRSRILRVQTPYLTIAAVLLMLLSMDSVISRTDGLLLLLMSVIFTQHIIHDAKKQRILDEQIAGIKAHLTPKEVPRNLALLALGVGLLIVGAYFLILGATSLATGFHIPEIVIGITILAVGTNLPELVTSIIASTRKQNEFVLGNIIGSSILNIFAVVGLTALLFPISATPLVTDIDIPIMIIFTFAFFIMLRTKHRISRVEGLLLLGGYIVYILYVFSRQ